MPQVQMRYYRLAKAFGFPPTVVDEQPAALLDWMLRIDDEVNDIDEKRQRRQQKPQGVGDD
jgi:hypothetical protein